MDFDIWTQQCLLTKKNYIHPLSSDTGCPLEDFLRAVADRDGWQEGIKGICADDDMLSFPET